MLALPPTASSSLAAPPCRRRNPAPPRCAAQPPEAADPENALRGNPFGAADEAARRRKLTAELMMLNARLAGGKPHVVRQRVEWLQSSRRQWDLVHRYVTESDTAITLSLIEAARLKVRSAGAGLGGVEGAGERAARVAAGLPYDSPAARPWVASRRRCRAGRGGSGMGGWWRCQVAGVGVAWRAWALRRQRKTLLVPGIPPAPAAPGCPLPPPPRPHSPAQPPAPSVSACRPRPPPLSDQG